MIIELYFIKDDENGLLIKDFLIKNNLKFHEILTKGIREVYNEKSGLR